MKEVIITNSESDKTQLLEELFGAWKDIDEDIISIIYNSRTISDKSISFDNGLIKDNGY